MNVSRFQREAVSQSHYMTFPLGTKLRKSSVKIGSCAAASFHNGAQACAPFDKTLHLLQPCSSEPTSHYTQSSLLSGDPVSQFQISVPDAFAPGDII